MLKTRVIYTIRLLFKWIVLFLVVLSISACGKKTDRTQVVYATAYAILTRTADAIASIPTQTPLPTQSATPVDRTLVPTTPETDDQQVDATPSPQLATLISQPTVIPTASQPTRIASPTVFSNQTSSNGGTFPVFPTNTSVFTATPTMRPSSTPPIQPPSQGVVGIWQQDPDGWVIQFNADGSYVLGPSFRYLTSDSMDVGQYSIQDDQITLIGSTTSVSCKSDTGVYQVQKLAATQHVFGLIQDECYDRQRIMASKNWYWLPVMPYATPAATSALEQPVRTIALTGAAGNSSAHLTGIDWSGDDLILLPQYPDFVGDGKSYLFTISRAEITEYLDDYFLPALEPQEIILYNSGISTQLAGFQGYQALAIIDDDVYLIAQSNSDGITRSYLIAGTIASDLTSITLDAAKVVEIPAQSGGSVSNYRSLIVTSDRVIAIPDLNGVSVNTLPTAQYFNRNLVFLNSLPVYNLDYVVTDASEPDSNGLFWVINKFAHGDLGGLTDADPLSKLYGEGVTHQAFDYMERLVSFHLTTNGVDLAASAPVQFELSAHNPRNWQGLTIFGDQGFLVVSNQANGTILGYVEKP